jgi:tryptophanase
VSASGRPERLAAAITGLADGVEDGFLRTQLHAVAALVEHLDARPLGVVAESGALAREIDAAMAAGDEAAVIGAARRLASAERATVRPVDWTQVSSG